ncbi:MAG: hypothetical protein ACQ9MH_04895 [Nitrospinales bacterium]
MRFLFIRIVICILVILSLGTNYCLALDKKFITGDKAWDKCSSLQEKWLGTLHEIVLSSKPHLKNSADLSLKWRFTTLKVNSLKFKYLLENDPDRIIRDKGLRSFMDLDWFWDDSRDLGKSNPDFLKWESEMSVLEKKNNKHPDWPELKAYLRSIAKDKEHKEKFDKFLSDLTGAMRENEGIKASAQ